jgi:hypothetical protein
MFQTVSSFIVGFVMFARRLLTLIMFGFLFISRLDKPLVPRGYEWIDPGFACYQGFLLVELCVLVFVPVFFRILWPFSPFAWSLVLIPNI